MKAQNATKYGLTPFLKVRPDPVPDPVPGWSALGPISLFIESVIGIHRIDALKKEVHWRLHRDTRHGIKRLRFGEIETDLIHENGACTVTASADYTLYINEQPFAIHPGEQILEL